MASRALFDESKAVILERDIASGSAATEGLMAVHSGSESEFANAGAGVDTGIGVFLDSVLSGDTDRGARIACFGGGILRVKVGTGGATFGKKAAYVADGFTDAAAHDSSGATNDAIYGTFMQTGVAGDFVGLLPAVSNRGSA